MRQCDSGFATDAQARDLDAYSEWYAPFIFSLGGRGRGRSGRFRGGLGIIGKTRGAYHTRRGEKQYKQNNNGYFSHGFAPVHSRRLTCENVAVCPHFVTRRQTANVKLE